MNNSIECAPSVKQMLFIDVIANDKSVYKTNINKFQKPHTKFVQLKPQNKKPTYRSRLYLKRTTSRINEYPIDCNIDPTYNRAQRQTDRETTIDSHIDERSNPIRTFWLARGLYLASTGLALPLNPKASASTPLLDMVTDDRQ